MRQFNRRVAAGELPASEYERASAIMVIVAEGERQDLPLLLRLAEGTPRRWGDTNNVTLTALWGLLPYAQPGTTARVRIEQVARDTAPEVRLVGALMLATINDSAARVFLRRFPLEEVADREFRTLIERASASPPCSADEYFEVGYGFEAQEFSGCVPRRGRR